VEQPLLPNVIFAILVIGVVGMLLDLLFARAISRRR
jgi:ABC-type nitrate/sulfonate/bicarbonate transport system permease component